MKNWKLEDLTRAELRQELAARGYRKVPTHASRGRLLAAVRADDEGKVLEKWW